MAESTKIVEFCKPVDVYDRVPEHLREKLREYEGRLEVGDKVARSVAQRILKSSFFPDQSNSFVRWMASQPKPTPAPTPTPTTS